MPYPYSVGDIYTASDANAVGLIRIETCTVTSTGGTSATASDGVITFGSGNTSITVSNAFNANFANYMILLNGGAGSATDVVRLTLGNTTTGYYYGGKARTYGGADLNIDNLNVNGFWYAGETSTNGLTGQIMLFGPQTATRTQFSSTFMPPRTDAYWLAVGGYLNDATQYTSFKMTLNTANQTGGTVRVYGFTNL